jgi:hypothetical protein
VLSIIPATFRRLTPQDRFRALGFAHGEDYIRCGTPDCDRGFKMPELSETRFKECCAKFRELCVERHDLRETETNAYMFFDLEEFTLTLFKDE